MIKKTILLSFAFVSLALVSSRSYATQDECVIDIHKYHPSLLSGRDSSNFNFYSGTVWAIGNSRVYQIKFSNKTVPDCYLLSIAAIKQYKDKFVSNATRYLYWAQYNINGKMNKVDDKTSIYFSENDLGDDLRNSNEGSYKQDYRSGGNVDWSYRHDYWYVESFPKNLTTCKAYAKYAGNIVEENTESIQPTKNECLQIAKEFGRKPSEKVKEQQEHQGLTFDEDEFEVIVYFSGDIATNSETIDYSDLF